LSASIEKFMPDDAGMTKAGVLDRTVADCPNVFRYPRHDHYFAPDTFLHERSICWGDHQRVRSTMLVAVRLLYHLGVRRVYIVGADFHMEPGGLGKTYGFDEDKDERACRSNNRAYKVINERFTLLRPYCEAAGFHVWNCTPGSRLTAWDAMTIEQAVEIERQ